MWLYFDVMYASDLHLVPSVLGVEFSTPTLFRFSHSETLSLKSLFSLSLSIIWHQPVSQIETSNFAESQSVRTGSLKKRIIHYTETKHPFFSSYFLVSLISRIFYSHLFFFLSLCFFFFLVYFVYLFLSVSDSLILCKALFFIRCIMLGWCFL